ncbi:SsrA-binding protein [Candidatus Uhrbacteria bacterium RIFCSPHIGHO2_12_FULL_54_23]|uniref:SsrA-binding protein n=3 Tax=Candidatus Uhriibacteriota TaxID=1752732 RepID=A0A1F7UN48_9BACT|nr:MAG: SsrA-binding protein [Candidatus Uhrbacteria bacterium RIFCSPHIGHO2_12_FULL_54_23]OGL84797.1 MAG: SsrA-binding protein [Candidatus Uhrbacteria bacterium RIFCSPLOWO2_01_FULL_55_36]OGL91066.1 MAG: SsrA-binding protein [Candidatus Uhrbacteria bacterium RIFCSPLOWO2_02_FULL_54_37]
MPTLAVNKRALHDYDISERFEAGIRLTGPEVKSVKRGQVSLSGAYARITPQGEAILMNASIAPYPPAVGAQKQYDPHRDRTLLLHKREIASLIGKSRTQGHTLIPLSFYSKRGLIKVELGLGRGKKQHDKREAIKTRDFDRKKRQLMSS